MLGRMKKSSSRKTERGVTLPEFAIGGLVFITAIIGIIELSRLFLTHNQLTDAVRRGARYAATTSNTTGNITAIKNMVVYGNTAGTGSPSVLNLNTSQVAVTFSSPYDTKNGTVKVTITGFTFRLNVPLPGVTITLPVYQGAVSAESAGRVPATI